MEPHLLVTDDDYFGKAHLGVALSLGFDWAGCASEPEILAQGIKWQPELTMKFSPIALASVCWLLGCAFVAPPPSIPPQEPNVVSLAPENWYIYYSEGMPSNPSADGAGAWSLEFPSSEADGQVNYVQTPFNSTTALHNVSVTFRVDSSEAQYVVLDPGDILPATFHLFIEQKGDDLSNPNGRWWAQTGGYNLGSHDNETITLSVPLTADQWTNVDGQYNAQEFPAALENIGWIGLTCGGQYFWGHGVALRSGSAKLILIDFHVN